MMGKKMDPRPGVPSSYLKLSQFAEAQLMQLAEAIPQERFTWRPEEGVRSMAEAFLHAAWGNYLILAALGAAPPAGVDWQNIEKSTADKQRIVDALKRSFEAMNGHVAGIAEGDYSAEVEFFGMKMTKLDMIFSAVTHQWQSLGQAIAYARMNHIVPPWSAVQPAGGKKA